MLEDLQGLLDSLSASVPHASASLASLRSTIDSLRASAAATPTALAGLTSSVRGVGAATAPAAAQTNTFSASIGQSAASMLRLPGPIGMVQDALSRMGVAGQAAAAALGAATIVVTAMVASLAALSVAAVSVAEKLSMMRSVLGAIHGAAAGNGITAMVQRLSGQLPIASDQLAGWAKSLSFVAQNGKQLETMMRSVAAAQALMGDSGAAAATSMLETLGRGGAAAAALVAKFKMGLPEARAELAKMGLKTVDLANALGMTEAQFKRSRLTAAQFNEALQKALQRKGAGPLGEMAATWPAIIMKAKEGFLSLFDKLGPAVKPFMHAVQKLFGEFSKGGSAVNTVKPIVTSVLTTLFSWATKAVHAIHEIVKAFTGAGKAGGFFSGAIVVLKAGWAALSGIFKAVSIALTPAIALLKAIFTNALVLRGLKVIFTIIVAAVTAVVVAFAALGAVFGAIAGIVGAGMAALAGIPAAMAGLAGDMIAGLVSGIANGAGAVAAAMSGLAGSALGAFKGVLGIASPSKVMMEHGDEDTAGAFAGGMDKGGAKVKSASKRLGEAAKPGKGKGAASGGADGQFVFHNCQFVGTTEDVIRRMMGVVFEQMAAEAGAEAT